MPSVIKCCRRDQVVNHHWIPRSLLVAEVLASLDLIFAVLCYWWFHNWYHSWSRRNMAFGTPSLKLLS